MKPSRLILAMSTIVVGCTLILFGNNFGIYLIIGGIILGMDEMGTIK